MGGRELKIADWELKIAAGFKWMYSLQLSTYDENSRFLHSFFSILKDREMVRRVEISTISPRVKIVTVQSALAMQRVQRIPSKNLGAITNREMSLSGTFG